MTSLIRNEYAKMKRLHVAPLLVLLTLGVSGMTIFYALGSGIAGETASDIGHKMLLAGLGMATSLAAPILLAVLASRQVEVEHTGNGWLAAGTAGVTPGRLCRAKFAALGAAVSAVTVTSGLLVIAFGAGLGIDAPMPLTRWAGYITALVVINLAVLAFHLLLSSRVENQLPCIGLGLVGVFVAVFGEVLPSWFAHLVPWGYYASTRQADFVGERLVYLDPPGASVAGLAVVGGAVFLLLTGRFDRQEA